MEKMLMGAAVMLIATAFTAATPVVVGSGAHANKNWSDPGCINPRSRTATFKKCGSKQGRGKKKVGELLRHPKG